MISNNSSLTNLTANDPYKLSPLYMGISSLKYKITGFQNGEFVGPIVTWIGKCVFKNEYFIQTITPVA